MSVIFMLLIVASSILGVQLFLQYGIAEINPVMHQSGVFDFLFAVATSPWVLTALNAWLWFGLLLISAGVVILNVAAPKAPAEAQAA